MIRLAVVINLLISMKLFSQLPVSVTKRPLSWPNIRLGFLTLCLGLALVLGGCNDFFKKDIVFGAVGDSTSSASSSSASSGDDGGSGGDTSPDDDNDGLSNDVETLFGIDTLVADTDGDGISDGLEFVGANGDPLDNTEIPTPLSDVRFLLPDEIVSLDPDRDQDGLGDLFERNNDLDPDMPDTDSDGYNDSLELIADSDPRSATSRPVRVDDPAARATLPSPDSIPDDSDLDGISDQLENLNGTDIQNRDTDGDGFSDGVEYVMGSEGTDERSIPSF